MELVQQSFDYAWQATVYLFLAWLVYYFIKHSSKLSKAISVSLIAAVLTLSFTTDLVDNSIDLVFHASDMHIASLNQKLASM